jgi:ankyrin repeat protein
LYRVLDAPEWLEILDRSAAGSLFEERRLEGLSGTTQSEATPSFVDVRAADMVLRLKTRRTHEGAFLDLWCDEIAGSRRRRIWTLPYGDIVVTAAADDALRQISERYPGAGRDMERREQTACGSIRRIAVAGLQPVSADAPDPDGIEDLLAVALSGHDCLELVERSEIARVIQELERSDLADEELALQLGALINAHAILTGFYGFQDGILTLDGRLIETRTGAIVQHIRGSAGLAELAELENTIVEGILAATRPTIQGSDNRMLRILESKVHERELSGEEGLKAAAMVSPDSPDFHYKLGNQRKQENRLDEALAHYYDGMTLAEQKGAPWKFYLAANGILRKNRQMQERVFLWTRAVKQYEEGEASGGSRAGGRGSKQEDDARLYLAESLFESNSSGVALSHLEAIGSHSYRRGRLYEKLDQRRKAIEEYSVAVATDRFPLRAHSGMFSPYAALVRLLRSSEEDSERQQILDAIGSISNPEFLYQKIRALDQLTNEVPEDEALRLRAAKASVSAHQHNKASAHLAKLLRTTRDASVRLNALNELRMIYHSTGEAGKEKKVLQEIVDAKRVPADSRMIFDAALQRLERLDAGHVRAPIGPGRKQASRRRQIVVQAEDTQYIYDHPARVSRRDGSSGEIVWERDLEVRAQYQRRSDSNSREQRTMTAAGLVCDGEYLFVPIADRGVIHALNAQTGEPAWLYTDWAPVSRPFLMEGRLYVGNALGDLAVLSPKTGETLHEIVNDVRREDRPLSADSLALLYDADTREIKFMRVTQHAIRVDELSLLGEGDQRMRGSLINHSIHLDTLEIVSAPGKRKRNDTSEVIDKEIEKILDPARRKQAGYGDGDTRIDAIRRVMRLPGREKAIPVLVSVCRDRVHYLGSERSAAVKTLSAMCGAAILPELLPLAQDPVPDLRREAAVLIGRFGSDSHRELLTDLVYDVDAGVQRAALQSLVALIGLEARPYLQPFLDDKYSAVRSDSALYLLVAGDRSIEPLVHEVYRDYELDFYKDESFRKLALLCKARLPSALKTLQQIVRKGDEPALRNALGAIAEFLPDPSLMPILLDEVDSEDPNGERMPVSVLRTKQQTRAYAAAAIAAMNHPAAIPFLVEAVGKRRGHGADGEPDPIMIALEELTGQALGDRSYHWKYWWESAGRQMHDPGDLEMQVSEEIRQALRVVETPPSDDTGAGGPCRLCEAAINGDLAKLTRMLDAGADINQRDEFGRSPLVNAVRSDHPEVAMELMKRGADVNLTSLENETPLMYTTEHGDLALTKELVRRGAILSISSMNGSSALYQATQNNHLDIVKFILESGVDVDFQPLREKEGPGTALVSAVHSGYMDIARYLISKGADLEGTTSQGETSLIMSTYDNRPEFTSMLIEAGANVDAANAYGWTAILMGAQFGNIEPIKLLLDANANVDAVTSFGGTALSLAVASGNRELAELLVDAGADIDLAILALKSSRSGGKPRHLQWLESKRNKKK